MKRYKNKFEEMSDVEIQNYFVSLFDLYKKEPEFIGRFIFTLLNNSLIKTSRKNNKFDINKIKKSILATLNRQW